MKMKLVSFALAVAIPVADGFTTAQELRPLLLDRQRQQQALLQQQRGKDSEESNTSIALQKPELTPDGFPKLPEVTKMLTAAQDTLKGLTQQTAALEVQVEKAQRDKARKMTQQKAAFENKLRIQELANRALIEQNKEITKQIGLLKQGNGDIRAHAKQLEDANLVMREELLALEGRLGSAQDFVGQALESTDDSHAKDLLVLSETPSKPKVQIQATEATAETSAVPQLVVHKNGAAAAVKKTAEVDLADGQDGDDDAEGDDNGAPSLLALGVRRKALKPTGAKGASDARTLIRVLQNGVASLSEQEHASEAQLKALFVSSFKAGKARHMNLLSTQQNLNSTHASLVALQGQLRTAELHLQATKKKLSADLHDVGVFLQKLAHLALAPAPMAPSLIKALPGSVGTPAAAAAPSTSAPTTALSASSADDTPSL